MRFWALILKLIYVVCATAEQSIKRSDWWNKWKLILTIILVSDVDSRYYNYCSGLTRNCHFSQDFKTRWQMIVTKSFLWLTATVLANISSEGNIILPESSTEGSVSTGDGNVADPDHSLSGPWPRDHSWPHAMLAWACRVSNEGSRRITITAKAPSRAFSLLKASTRAFTFNTQLFRHTVPSRLEP